MKCDEFTLLIDSYLKGDIPEEKREDFESHYFECDRCFLELQIHEQLLEKKVTIRLNNHVIPIHFRPWLVAATLILAILSSFLVVTSWIQHRSIMQISQFDPPIYIESETRNFNNHRDFSKAMTLYNQGHYGEALKVMKAARNGDDNPQVIFFRGICYLIENQEKNAIQEFNTIIRNTNPSYYDEALYYKGVALLRQGRSKDSLELLESLAKMFSPYASRAKSLAEKIKNM